MSSPATITIAAKCAPDEQILTSIEKAGLSAVELYTNLDYLRNLSKVKKTCRKFPFRYAVHAPNDCFEPDLLAELLDELKAEVVVFHDIFWDDEWEQIASVFTNVRTKVCVENTHSVHEPLKLMRRFGMKRCLDIEHLQMQCAGVFEEEFLPVIRQAAHIHLTGYFYGSDLWHTHIHHSPQHGIYFLNLISREGYSGLVVSEAKTSLQTYEEFKKLKNFIVQGGMK